MQDVVASKGKGSLLGRSVMAVYPVLGDRRPWGPSHVYGGCGFQNAHTLISHFTQYHKIFLGPHCFLPHTTPLTGYILLVCLMYLMSILLYRKRCQVGSHGPIRILGCTKVSLLNLFISYNRLFLTCHAAA